MTIVCEVGDQRITAECLEESARIAGVPGWAQRAGRLLGAAEILREHIRAPLPPSDRADSEDHVAAVRAALGEEAFAAAWAEGRAMSLEDALAYAIEDAPHA